MCMVPHYMEERKPSRIIATMTLKPTIPIMPTKVRKKMTSTACESTPSGSDVSIRMWTVQLRRARWKEEGREVWQEGSTERERKGR